MSINGSNIADFIPSYPLISEPNFNIDIFRHKEFYNSKLSSHEIVPKTTGVPLQHQDISRKYFSPFTSYVECLYFNAVGSGKTCEASFIVEGLKNSLLDKKIRKPAIILVQNEDQVKLFQTQLAQRCTTHLYTPDNPKESTRRMQEMEITRKLSKVYKVERIRTFIKGLAKKTDAQLIEEYSERVFFVDEAHHVRIKTKLYQPLFRLFHVVVDCHKFLLTGTPIVDHASEFADLINLILPIKEQLPTGNQFLNEFFNGTTLIQEERLKAVLKGRVSYLRATMTTARRELVGMTKPWLDISVVYPDVMSWTQSAAAKVAAEEFKIEYTKTGKEKEVQGGTFLISAISASNMVIPAKNKKGELEISSSREAYEYAVKRRSQTVKSLRGGPSIERVTFELNETVEFLLLGKTQKRDKPSLDTLAEYSAKFASIIHHILAHPDEVVFVYNESVTGVGGCIMFALLLQKFGFYWARSAGAIARQSDAKRFAVMTNENGTIHHPREIEKFLKRLNTKDNISGKLCQVIIGSEKIGEAITIKNVRQAHIVDGSWSFSTIDQALGRVFRAGSHDLLPPNDRFINIYQHVIVYPATDEETDKVIITEGYPKDAEASSKETVDTYIYSIAEKKDQPIAEIYRCIKEAAWNCPLFYDRNVLETDVPGSRDCNYKEQCNYKCDGIPSKYIDQNQAVWKYSVPKEQLITSDYNYLYSTDTQYLIIKKVTELFKLKSAYTLDEIKIFMTEVSENIPEFVILTALNTLVSERIPLKNKLGFTCYVKEDVNVYYIDLDMVGDSDIWISRYVENPIVTEKFALENVVERSQLRDTVKKMCDYVEFIAKGETIKAKDVLMKLDQKSIATMLELCISHRDTYNTEKIVNSLSDYFYKFGDIIVHTLYSDIQTGVRHKRVSKATGLTRIFDLSNPELGWRYIKGTEEMAILEKTKQRKQEIITEMFAKTPVFASFTKRGDLLVHTKGGLISVEQGKGRVCTSYLNADLGKIYKALDYLSRYDENFKDYSKKKLLNLIDNNKYRTNIDESKEDLENFSKNKLRRILTFLNVMNTNKKTGSCFDLMEWLKSKGYFLSVALE